MNDAQIALARKLVDSPEWRYQAGMLVMASRDCSAADVPLRILRWDGDACAGVSAREMPSGRFEQCPVYAGALVDLTDPSTGGILLAMCGPGLTLMWRPTPEGLLATFCSEVPVPLVRIIVRLEDGRYSGQLGDCTGEAAAKTLLARWGRL